MNITSINIEKFKKNAFKLMAVAALAGTLTACATKDLEAPVVKNVSIEETTLTIEANDNKGVASYAITEKNEAPAVDSTEWQTSNTFLDVENGTYYIWVKDASNNVSSYNKEVTISVVSEYEKNFDLTKWDDRTIDQDLKQKYGDAYAFVEPLTKEEIEKRFEFLVWFSEEQYRTPIMTYFSNYTGISYTNELENNVSARTITFHEAAYNFIFKSNDPKMEKFKNYFKISPVLGVPTIDFPNSFDSLDGALGLTQENKVNVTFEDKEFFVRYVSAIHDIQIELMKDMGLEIKYYFDEPGFTFSDSYTK